MGLAREYPCSVGNENSHPNQDVPVVDWKGDIQVGSATPGMGVTVQKQTWKLYQGHGAHEDVVRIFPCHPTR